MQVCVKCMISTLVYIRWSKGWSLDYAHTAWVLRSRHWSAYTLGCKGFAMRSTSTCLFLTLHSFACASPLTAKTYSAPKAESAECRIGGVDEKVFFLVSESFGSYEPWPVQEQLEDLRAFLGSRGVLASQKQVSELPRSQNIGLPREDALDATIAFLLDNLHVLKVVMVSTKPETKGCRQACLYRYFLAEDPRDTTEDGINEPKVLRWLFERRADGDTKSPSVLDLRENPEWIEPSYGTVQQLKDEVKAIWIPPKEGYSSPIFFLRGVDKLDLNRVLLSLQQQWMGWEIELVDGLEGMSERTIMSEIFASSTAQSWNGKLSPWNPLLLGGETERFFDHRLVEQCNAESPAHAFESTMVSSNGTHRNVSISLSVCALLEVYRERNISYAIDELSR